MEWKLADKIMANFLDDGIRLLRSSMVYNRKRLISLENTIPQLVIYVFIYLLVILEQIRPPSRLKTRCHNNQ